IFMIGTDARAKRARLLVGLLGLTLGACSAMEGRSGAGNAGDNENEGVGEVALALDTPYTGSCPTGRLEQTADGRPGCRTNFDVCQDVDVARTGYIFTGVSTLYTSGPETLNLGEWGAFP